MVLASIVAAAAAPTAAHADEPSSPAVSLPPEAAERALMPKAGSPCCDAAWCVTQETTCESRCDGMFRAGSRKWTACHGYCSKQLGKCSSCCRAHRVPNCNVYCFTE